MKAAVVNFRLESASMYLKEFYASKMGTLDYFSKEAIANAITYKEMFKRDKKQDWEEMQFSFDNTPAVPTNFSRETIVYKAGDDPKKGLLRYGKQEVLMPGSEFRFIVWGDFPELKLSQIFFIGKKRAPAKIVSISQEFDVKPSKEVKGNPFPIQVNLTALKRIKRYILHVATSRFFIISIPPGEIESIAVDRFIVPLIQA